MGEESIFGHIVAKFGVGEVGKFVCVLSNANMLQNPKHVVLYGTWHSKAGICAGFECPNANLT